MIPAMMAGPAMQSVAGAAAGGPATSGSNQDTSSAFTTGAKNISFGAPPQKNAALQNPFVIGGIVLAVGLVAVVWVKSKK